ncbi:hypothetical protein [Methanobacterium sp.]|uniref:hypothetical protein n=1 Tax=Methanobacterium sp. TaxID=2164 RepID=UPI003C763CBF
MKYSKKHGVFLLTVLFLAIILCSTASAANTTGATDVNSSIASLNDTNNILDPVISGKVIENPSNSGLSGVSIRAETTGGSLLAETTTGTNGTYSLNFISSDKAFKITASKLGYISYTQNVNVSPNAADPNTLYGTANFTLYKLPAYSGNASSYVLNVGVLPQVLLDLYAGKSSSWVNSTASPYASSADTPLEIKLLNGSLLSGLLNVNSTGDQGTINGGILPSNLPTLLQVLGLKIGLLNATATSGTHPPASSGGSSVASVDLNLLNLIPVLNLGLISANSSVIPNSNISAVTSSSSSGVADITLLGGLLQIKALQVNATASANGQPGGASANFKWSVADILLNGKSILSELTAKLSVELPGVLKISLGNPVTTIAADGTSASVYGDALDVELLGLLLGGVKLTIGHADAAAQFAADPKADLSLTKTVDDATPQYQQNITFTLTAHNNGPANATNVTVTDKLPVGLKFVSTDGAYNATTGVWTVGNLANGATAILHIVAQAIVANTQLTNTAIIGGNQTDTNSSNNQGNVTVNVGSASDLGINITASSRNPAYLSYVTFTLTAHNYGPNDAANVKVYNTLPKGFKYVSNDSNGKFNATSGLWAVGPLANGASAILHIVAQAMISNATVTDTANITDPDPTNTTEFYDPNSGNDNASVTVDVGPATDPAIAITASVPRCCNQDEVTFTITARNNGPNNATGVTVMTKLPAELKFMSVNGDGTYDSLTGTWTIGNLASGVTSTLKVVGKANAARTTVTTSAAIFGYELDLNDTNNQANITTILDPLTDLSITKTADKSTVNYLQNVTFTLTARNNGPDNATGVTATDKLPAGLKFVSATGSGVYNATTGVWTIGDLASGATATLKIVAQAITSSTQLTNTAVINPNTAANENDRNTTNNQANVTVTVNSASDLGITKTVSNANPKYLENVTFTLTAHNNGPDVATGVTVTDKLPPGLKFVSASGSGTYDSATGVWTIGNLANGADAILKIVAQVTISNGQVTNVAVINETNYDQNSTNNQNNSTVVVGPASDLSIIKTANTSKINYLGQVTFTLTARNNGPDAAAGVTVTDKLPAGLKFVSTDGNYNATTGIWTIGSLASGATAILHIVAQGIAANAALTNVAIVSGTNYDQNTTNNQGNTTVTTGPASDLGITMSVNNPHPKFMDYVTFTLTATNAGPNAAPNVKVYVTLPSGLKFISADGAYNATYNSTTGLWSIGPMAVGTTKILHIVAQAMVSNIVLTAKAYITDPPEDELSINDFFDPNENNDNADATVDVGANGSSDTGTNTPSKTISMQKTGIPIAGMLLAALMVFVGIRPRIK